MFAKISFGSLVSAEVCYFRYKYILGKNNGYLIILGGGGLGLSSRRFRVLMALIKVQRRGNVTVSFVAPAVHAGSLSGRFYFYLPLSCLYLPVSSCLLCLPIYLPLTDYVSVCLQVCLGTRVVYVCPRSKISGCAGDALTEWNEGQCGNTACVVRSLLHQRVFECLR